MLIGEKTVPRGCRVMYVNQNGMQLHCEADGRLLTFKDGDNVDVHVTIQHEGRQKKLTIPSWVRNVTTDSVEVEFHRPDPELLDLIESYRVSEHHRLEASLGRTDRRTARDRDAVNPGNTPGGEQFAEQMANQAQRQQNRPYYTLILAIVFAVCVITGGYVYTASIDSRISSLETVSKRQSTELAEMQSRLFSASLQEGRYASLNARMTAIADAINSLEARLGPDTVKAGGAPAQKAPGTAVNSIAKQKRANTPAASSTLAAAISTPIAIRQDDVAPPPAAPPEAEAPPPGKSPGETAGPAATGGLESSTAAAEKTVAGPGQQQPRTGKPAAAIADEGPWIINLLSSTDKAYIERFSRKSGAGKYHAVLNSAMVKGRQYWRLQITGFKSAAAAKKQAGTVKQELGIKDVWIFKRK